MGFKLIITEADYNAVTDEGVKKHYIKQDDGSYRLDVDGVVPSEKLAEFRENNIKLTNENAELKKTQEAYKDIDPKKYGEYKQAFDKQLSQDDIDKIVNERVAPIVAEKDKSLSELQVKLDGANTQIKNGTILNEIRQYANQFGARPSALVDIEQRALGQFDLINGNVAVIDKDGKIAYGADGVSPKGPKEWMSDLQKSADHLFDKNSGGGAGGGAAPNQDRSKMTALQKIQAGIGEA